MVVSSENGRIARAFRPFVGNFSVMNAKLGRFVQMNWEDGNTARASYPSESIDNVCGQLSDLRKGHEQHVYEEQKRKSSFLTRSQ